MKITRPSVSRPVSRRSLGRAGVWAIPAVTVAAAAPAWAVASPTACPALSPYGEAWVLTTSGSSQADTARFSNGDFVFAADGPTDGTSYVAHATATIPVQVGVTYTFTYTYRVEAPENLIFAESVLTVGGETFEGSRINTQTSPPTGTVAVSYTPTTSGTVPIVVEISITNYAEGLAGQDLILNPMSVTCS